MLLSFNTTWTYVSSHVQSKQSFLRCASCRLSPQGLGPLSVSGFCCYVTYGQRRLSVQYTVREDVSAGHSWCDTIGKSIAMIWSLGTWHDYSMVGHGMVLYVEI